MLVIPYLASNKSPEIMTLLLQVVSTANQPEATVSAAVISASVVVVSSIVTLAMQAYNNRKTNEYNLRILAEKKTEEQRKDIYKRLNEFYGPFQQYLNKSLELYRIFSANKPDGFRSLTYFLDREQQYAGYGKVTLTKNEEAIFAEIISIGEKLEEIIVTKAGLVDDPILRQDFTEEASGQESTGISGSNGMLAFLGTHLLVMRLAYKGELQGDTQTYSKYVFPRGLPNVVENNITRLNKELERLNSVS